MARNQTCASTLWVLHFLSSIPHLFDSNLHFTPTVWAWKWWCLGIFSQDLECRIPMVLTPYKTGGLQRNAHKYAPKHFVDKTAFAWRWFDLPAQAEIQTQMRSSARHVSSSNIMCSNTVIIAATPLDKNTLQRVLSLHTYSPNNFPLLGEHSDCVARRTRR